MRQLQKNTTAWLSCVTWGCIDVGNWEESSDWTAAVETINAIVAVHYFMTMA